MIDNIWIAFWNIPALAREWLNEFLKTLANTINKAIKILNKIPKVNISPVKFEGIWTSKLREFKELTSWIIKIKTWLENWVTAQSLKSLKRELKAREWFVTERKKQIKEEIVSEQKKNAELLKLIEWNKWWSAWWWTSRTDNVKKQAKELEKIEKERLKNIAEQENKYRNFLKQKEEEKLEKLKEKKEKEIKLIEVAQKQINEAIKESEDKIEDYWEQIEKVSENFEKLKQKAVKDIEEINKKLASLETQKTTDIASRVIEIEEKLKEGDIDINEKKKLEEELQLAKKNTTDEAIKEAKRQALLSTTEKILEEIQAEKEKLEAKKINIQEELQLEADKTAKEIENLSLKQAEETKILEKFWEIRIRLEQKVTERLAEEQQKQIEQVKKVENAYDRLIKKIQKARALWWWNVSLPSNVWSEQWNTTNNTNSSVNLNLWNVNVTNEADENRLVEKIKTSLVNATKNAQKWIL